FPNLQGFHDAGEVDYANPIGTIQGQYDIWKEFGMIAKGCAIYAWRGGAGSGSKGIYEIPGLLEEVTEFNKNIKI
ncbi:unnamed protein product, partial [marine sediment metagenome]